MWARMWIGRRVGSQVTLKGLVNFGRSMMIDFGSTIHWPQATYLDLEHEAIYGGKGEVLECGSVGRSAAGRVAR